MNFELWQIPVLVMAGIIVIEFAGSLLPRRRRFTITAAQMRLAINATVLAGLLVFFAIGFFEKDTSLADRFVTVVTGVMNVGMTYWTYRAFHNAKHARPSGTSTAAAEPGNDRDPENTKS